MQEKKKYFGGVDGETQFFDGHRWKCISDYDPGDMALQYDPDGTAVMVKPDGYIAYQNNKKFWRYNGELCTSMVGSNDVVFRIDDDTLKKVKMKEVVRMLTGKEPLTSWMEGQHTSRAVPTAFQYDPKSFNTEKTVEIPPATTRLIASIVGYDAACDEHGWYACPYEWFEYSYEKDAIFGVYQLHVVLGKEGVNNRLEFNDGHGWLYVDGLDIRKYLDVATVCPDRQEADEGTACVFAFNTETDWYMLSAESKDVFRKYFRRAELPGLFRGNYEQYSTLQFLFVSGGWRFTADGKQFTADSYGYAHFDTTATGQKFTRFLPQFRDVSMAVPEDDCQKYILQVPSGMVILRHDRKVFVAGCGGEK